jgi:hypothetical protein
MTLWHAGRERWRRTCSPLTTHEDAEKTARGSLQGTAGPEGADTADNLKTE